LKIPCLFFMNANAFPFTGGRSALPFSNSAIFCPAFSDFWLNMTWKNLRDIRSKWVNRVNYWINIMFASHINMTFLTSWKQRWQLCLATCIVCVFCWKIALIYQNCIDMQVQHKLTCMVTHCLDI
jgi:hypothetical protein